MKHSDEVLSTTQADTKHNDALTLRERTASSTASGIALADVDKLDSFELLYHLYKQGNQKIIGNPTSAFALFEESRNALSVFTRHDEYIFLVDHSTDGVLSALQSAQIHGANFTVKGKEVYCTISDVTCRGSDYGDAALRTLLKCHLKVKNSARKTSGPDI